MAVSQSDDDDVPNDGGIIVIIVQNFADREGDRFYNDYH